MDAEPLWRIILKAVSLVAVPIIVFVAGAWVMDRQSGRASVPRPDPAAVCPEDLKPLNQRFGGYSAEAARRYWDGLGEYGRSAEMRFLELDLLFPFVYGGAFLAALLVAWASLGRRFGAAYVVVPVIVVVLADWTENLVHIGELRKHMRAGATTPDALLIGVASAATVIKLVVGVGVVLLLAVLAIWLVRVAVSPPTSAYT